MTDKKNLAVALGFFALALACFVLAFQWPLAASPQPGKPPLPEASMPPDPRDNYQHQDDRNLTPAEMVRIMAILGAAPRRDAPQSVLNSPPPSPSAPELTRELSTLGQMEMNGTTVWGFTDKTRNTSFFVAIGERWGPWFLKSVQSDMFVFVKEGKEYALPRY